MNILIANNQLSYTGGTEKYTFALGEELKRRKFNVEYFTFKKGQMSRIIEEKLQIPFFNGRNYDLILANHNSTINKLT